MQGSSRPTVFVSSTIRDFQDLRGALKFWLEESGFEVWLSEFNDMEIRPEANAFDACFEAVRRADFYILLVGENRGSLYSEPDGVSVTQQEYREARAAFQAHGRPIPILLLRASVKDQLSGWPLPRGGRRSTRPRRPPFPNAAFVESFIIEVERVQETAGAVKGIGPYPAANWLHRFSSFRDVVDALRIALLLRANIPVQRTMAAIQFDLEMTLSALVEKVQRRVTGDERRASLQLLQERLPVEEREARGRISELMEQARDEEVDTPYPTHRYLDPVVLAIPLNANPRIDIILDQPQKQQLMMFLLVGAPMPERLWLSALEQAATSGVLLDFDPSSRRFVESDLSRAVSDVIEAAHSYINQYRALLAPVSSAVLQTIKTANLRKDDRLKLDWDHAVNIWAVYHSQVKLYRRVASLYGYLRKTKTTPVPEKETMPPVSPFGWETDEKVARERASQADIQSWFSTTDLSKL